MNQDEYHRQVYDEVERWEARGPSFLERLSATVLAPAHKAAEALIPAGIGEEVSATLESAMSGLQRLSHTLVDTDRLGELRHEMAIELGSELAAGDALARRCWGWNVAYAGAEGAVTGLGGWAGFLLDVPALYALSLRTLIEIGTSYGFDMESPSEQCYVHELMSMGSGGVKNGKLGFAVELKKVELGLLHEAQAALSLGSVAARKTAEAIGSGMVRRKSLQLLPVLGGVFGATLNAAYVHDLAETGYMCYRRRRVVELLTPPVAP